MFTSSVSDCVGGRSPELCASLIVSSYRSIYLFISFALLLSSQFLFLYNCLQLFGKRQGCDVEGRCYTGDREMSRDDGVSSVRVDERVILPNNDASVVPSELVA